LDVAELVFWTPPSGRDGRLAARARGLLDDFVEGGFITVGEDPFDKDATCIMARVDPIRYDIFDFRCLDPKPGIRILGAFSERDTFIAVTWDYRQNFDDAWPEQVANCKDAWEKLFGTIPRHHGNDIHDYISFNVRSV
jgi:hypothetical protein